MTISLAIDILYVLRLPHKSMQLNKLWSNVGSVYNKFISGCSSCSLFSVTLPADYGGMQQVEHISFGTSTSLNYITITVVL